MTSPNLSILREFTLPDARPLPLLLLLDASGSMAEHGKIEAVNNAIQDLLTTLANEKSHRVGVHVGALAFGGKLRPHLDLMPAHQAVTAWRPLSAAGGTPMGATFEACHKLLEDRRFIPSRAYRPTLVLISDGMPTDAWEAPLDALLKSPRAAKATRLAMGIGPDADTAMLARFIQNPEISVFNGSQASEISRFFRWVTMSVIARSVSATPDQVLPPPPPSLDDDDQIHY